VVVDRLLVKQGIALRLEQSIATALSWQRDCVTVAVSVARILLLGKKRLVLLRHQRSAA